MYFKISFGRFIIAILIAFNVISLIYIYKILKKRKNYDQYHQELPYLKKKSSKGITFYTINIQTNSNIIALKEPNGLQCLQNGFIGNILEEKTHGLELKYCQLCGAITDIKADYCYYCGSKLGFIKRRTKRIEAKI